MTESPNDKNTIVDGCITFVALLKNVCGLNKREVSSITESGITSFNMNCLKEMLSWLASAVCIVMTYWPKLWEGKGIWLQLVQEAGQL
jgi:hypothetical protein